MTTFSDGLFQFGGTPVPSAPLSFTGKSFWVDVVNGSDGNVGTSPSKAFSTLYAAHAAATAGNNDVVYLIGDGASTGTARLSLANAQVWDSAASAGTLVWSKNATHLIGVGSPTRVGQRARIAPPSGTYTAATFGSAAFITVSGSGCYFSNFSVFNGFSTGGTNQIAATVSGSRNTFSNVNVQGMGDDASAQSAGSRSVKISGGENTFINCVIGNDTVTRTQANASVEFASATARNTFQNCVFPFHTSAAGVLGVLGTGAFCMDRWQLFEQCTFVNNVKSTSTAMTVLGSLTNASPGGMLLYRYCTLVGIGEYGDTIALAHTYIDGGTVTAATTGIAVAPT